MNTNLKKVLIILVIILVLALIAFLVYNFFFKKPAEEAGGPGGLPYGQEGGAQPSTREGGGIIPSPELKIKAISTERVLAPTLSADKTKVIYYAQANGNVWQVAFDGSGLTRISSAVLNNLVKIIWSPDKTKVISVYQDPDENIFKSIYDYKTGKVSPLNSYIQEITWSPNSDKIAYQYTNDITKENNISTANPDGANWKSIFQTRMKSINLEWIGTEISFYEKPSGIAPGSLFVLNSLTKKLDKVLSDVYGMSIKWSPLGDKILYSKTGNTGKGIGLYLSPKNGSAETNLGLYTFVEKCVWSLDNRTIFCAIPKNTGQNNVFPDDFYKGVFVSDDEFWKINLETGERTILLEESEIVGGPYDATDLFLSPLEDYLFFVNKIDGLLYSIKL